MERVIDYKIYRIPMIDLKGIKFEIAAHSIAKIPKEINGVDYAKVNKCFPDFPQD